MRAVKIPFAEEETEVRKSSDSSKFTKLRRLAAGQARGQKRECRWSLGARRVGSSVRSRAQGPRRGGGQPTGEVSVSRSISVRGERATAVRAAPPPPPRGDARGRRHRKGLAVSPSPEWGGVGAVRPRGARAGARAAPALPGREGGAGWGRTARPGVRACDSRPAPRAPPPGRPPRSPPAGRPGRRTLGRGPEFRRLGFGGGGATVALAPSRSPLSLCSAQKASFLLLLVVSLLCTRVMVV